MSALISILLIFVFNVIFLIYAQNSEDNNNTKWSSRVMENWKSSLNEKENTGQNMPTVFNDPWNIKPERNMDGYEGLLNNNRAQSMRNRLRGSWNNSPQRETGRYSGLGNSSMENNPDGFSGSWSNSLQRHTGGYLGRGSSNRIPRRQTNGYNELLRNRPQERIQNGYQGSWNNNPETNEYTSSPAGSTSQPTGSMKNKPIKSEIIKSLKASLGSSPSTITASARQLREEDQNMPLELSQALKDSLLNVLGAVAKSLRGYPGAQLSQNLVNNNAKLIQRSNSLNNFNSSLNNSGSADSSPGSTTTSLESNLPEDVRKNLAVALESVQRNLAKSLGSISPGSVRRSLTGLSEDSPPTRIPNEDLATMSSKLRNTNEFSDSLMSQTSFESSGSLKSPSNNSLGNLRDSHQSSQSSKTQNSSRKSLNSEVNDFIKLLMRSPGNITLKNHPPGSTTNTDLGKKGSVMNIDLPSGIMGLLNSGLFRNKLSIISDSLKISPAKKTLSSIEMGTERTTNELAGLVKRNSTGKLLNKLSGSSKKSQGNNIQSKLQTDLFESSPKEDTPNKLSSSVSRKSARKARRGSSKSRMLKNDRSKRATREHTGSFEISIGRSKQDNNTSLFKNGSNDTDVGE